MAVPGTDLRSVPNDTPIAPIGDMGAVEATGGMSSDVGMEGAEGVSPELTMLINEIGPESVLMILEAVKGKVAKVEEAIASATAGPQGALSGMEAEAAPAPAPMM